MSRVRTGSQLGNSGNASEVIAESMTSEHDSTDIHARRTGWLPRFCFVSRNSWEGGSGDNARSFLI
ncbi:MAG: hypothetical protein Q7U51_05715 [Methanoregula sp.]|nr:hypothetical protein [Methanoregula sp.]